MSDNDKTIREIRAAVLRLTTPAALRTVSEIVRARWLDFEHVAMTAKIDAGLRVGTTVTFLDQLDQKVTGTVRAVNRRTVTVRENVAPGVRAREWRVPPILLHVDGAVPGQEVVS